MVMGYAGSDYEQIIKGACIAYCIETRRNELSKCLHECVERCRKDPVYLAEVLSTALNALDKRLHR